MDLMFAECGHSINIFFAVKECLKSSSMKNFPDFTSVIYVGTFRNKTCKFHITSFIFL